jgi:hypothetical protein
MLLAAEIHLTDIPLFINDFSILNSVNFVDSESLAVLNIVHPIVLCPTQSITHCEGDSLDGINRFALAIGGIDRQDFLASGLDNQLIRTGINPNDRVFLILL